MDAAVAKRMKDDLIGRTIGEWLVGTVLGYGQSALVFEGTNGTRKAAIKVFDPDLVQRAGRDVQLRRIQREKNLVGMLHPNLVQILGGGESEELLYVVMALLPWKTMAEELSRIPESNARSLLRQVAQAAHFLEQLELAHRDIKPANIAISDDLGTAILMDLGVLRPTAGEDRVTDQEHRTFVGTKQYSPPELLYRTEEDTPEGWRAVTFYQLGAVLYDMLEKRPLFEGREPEARMVEAVRSESPVLTRAGVPADLRRLALNCLVKDPNQRLKLVSWDDFLVDQHPTKGVAAKRRIIDRRGRTTGIPVVPSPDQSEQARLVARLRVAIEQAVQVLLRSGIFPPLHMHTQVNGTDVAIFARFDASESTGLPATFWLIFFGKIANADAKIITITAHAALGGVAQQHQLHVVPEAPSVRLTAILDEDTITTWVDDFAMQALDMAQSNAEANTVSDDVSWINVEG